MVQIGMVGGDAGPGCQNRFCGARRTINGQIAQTSRIQNSIRVGSSS